MEEPLTLSSIWRMRTEFYDITGSIPTKLYMTKSDYDAIHYETDYFASKKFNSVFGLIVSISDRVTLL